MAVLACTSLRSGSLSFVSQQVADEASRQALDNFLDYEDETVALQLQSLWITPYRSCKQGDDPAYSCNPYG